MTFASIAARATAAIFRHVSQTALLDEVEVEGVFDNTATDPFGIATSSPSFTLPTASATNVVQGSELRIDRDGSAAAAGIALSVAGAATAYRVRSVEPDGTGMTRLGLELAE